MLRSKNIMNNLALKSLERIKSAVNNVYGIYNLADWIEKYTYLDGKRFSFKDHEYQRPILEDRARTTIVVKCAQVGLSEILFRYAVAACATQDNFNAIITYPTSGESSKMAVTRIDPMIQGSPELKRLVDPNLSNSEVKRLGQNSFLFFKGTFSETAGLSIPADLIVHDEFDASDTTKASIYISRLQHRPHKLRKIFSTPTIEKYGVSKEAETAKRFKHLARCEHCNHVFLPDYYDHVVVPGWDKSLEEITKTNIHDTNWRDAYLACPKCGKDPNLHHTRMEYVCENPSENHEAHAYYVSPFSAHNIITPAYLVNTSTKFAKISEYKNQSLGKTAEEKNEQIQESDITAVELPNLNSSELHVLGADMGLICHVCIGRISSDGTLLVVHREKIHYTQFEVRTAKLMAEYRVVLTVCDSQPYTDLITRLSKSRPHTWGAIFVTTKSPTPFTLQKEQENPHEGKMDLKLVKINRMAALDSLLAIIKEGRWAVNSSDENQVYRQHMLSMKRVQKFTADGELTYVWAKTDGEDHYFMATLYLYIATQMRGTVGGSGVVSAGIPLVMKTKAPQY